jgi:hypothetical protein
VDKNCAPPASDTGSGIVVEFYDEVVKPVFPPQTIPLLVWTTFDMTIIPAICGIFDPCVVRLDRLGRQQGRRMGKAVGAPPEAHWVKLPARRCPVTFSLICRNA